MRGPSRTSVGVARGSYNGYTIARPVVLGFAKVLMGLSQASIAAAAPLVGFTATKHHDDDEPDADGPGLWLYLTIAMILVLLGGAFAGLTIALMGQDGIYLQVIATSGEGPEQKHAQKVYKLLKKGKHWVLVTLLLSNVIVNETLPIVLDRSLGGGWPAVLGSTVLIVIFGEVIPQSVCVRYGLQIGAFMAPCVLLLMWLMSPIAWPTARLLDYMLGEDHGTVYKKSGLKTLVTLHKTLGTSPGDRLNEDEVAIISAVLDLKAKPVGDIMTPMEDVFTMSADTVLDEKTMDVILSAGYSRIPIYEPGNETNFIGMLLVKILITYDPEDCKKVSEFSLATLPETRAETSCLDIVNFFQEGKSHMVLVSDFPGENYGASGVVTLEDVIEELIGEEIIDETDVYVDVHKAIRRLAPAPKARIGRGHVVADPEVAAIPEDDLLEFDEDGASKDAKKPDGIPKRIGSVDGRSPSPALATSPKATFMRRSSSGADGRVNFRGTASDMREHLKHLGPSNLASRPKTTRYNTVKIKQASSKLADSSQRQGSVIEEPYSDTPIVRGGEGEGLLRSAGKDASDGVQALQQGYGSIRSASVDASRSPETANKSAQANLGVPGADGAFEGRKPSPSPIRPTARSRPSEDGEGSDDTLGSLKSIDGSPPPRKKKGVARSGSITENIIESGGVRKVVLETNSSSEDADLEHINDGTYSNGKASKSSSSLLGSANQRLGINSGGSSDAGGQNGEATEVKKKKKKNKKKKKSKAEGGVGESAAN